MVYRFPNLFGIWLYLVGQFFNIALTFFAVWLLLSGVLFPVPHLS